MKKPCPTCREVLADASGRLSRLSKLARPMNMEEARMERASFRILSDFFVFCGRQGAVARREKKAAEKVE